MKIGRFLDSTPSWESEDPQERLKAVSEGQPPQETLESIAATDNDQSVRLAAIDRLENVAFALDLALASDGEQRRRAASRWTALVCENGNAAIAIEAVKAPAILAEFAKCASTIELRLQAVARIDDDNALTSILADENHSRVHQACTEKTDNEDRLEAIRKQFIDKDKGVHQIARDKLAALKAEREQHTQRDSECAEACAALEALAANQHETALARRLDALEVRWQELAREAPGEAEQFAARATAAIEACRKRIEESIKEQNAASEAAASVIEKIEVLEASLAESVSGLSSLAEDLAALRSTWPTGLSDADEQLSRYHAFVESAERAVQLSARLEVIDVEGATLKDLRDALSDFSWPLQFKEPEKVDVARKRLAELIDANEQEKAQRDQRITTTRNQLAEFENKIEAGNLKGSNKAHSTIAKSMSEHGAILPRELIDEFHRLTGRLTELRDWHRFVTNPKREELCNQMEALASIDTMHPPKKAKEIKGLQDAWKALGPSDNREAQELWGRFKNASDAAYKPCSAFFEDQKTQRSENMKAREAICEQLETFNAEHDWTSPNYREVGGLIARSLKAWREAGEVPRARFRKVSDRFSAALEPLQQRISAENERNREKKSALIERIAGHVADTETPLTELIEATKQAQKEWQGIGPAERRKEQKLWKAFRKECDALFARRNAERDEARKEANSARDACGQVIDRLKKRVAAGDIERGELRTFRAEFDDAAKQAGKGAPRKAFQGAIKQAERSIEQRAVRGRRLEIDELRRRAGLCEGLEDGKLTADAVEAEWEGDVELTAALADRIDARREEATSLADQDREKHLGTAALLCVRAEILAGIDSPEDAQPLRMQYQVERLNRELSQGQKDHRTPEEQFRDIQIEWFCLGGLPAGNDVLKQRFAATETKLAR